jgi:hypothetical protein
MDSINNVIFNILENIKNKVQFNWNDMNISKENFFDALEVIADNNFAKNIVFARGQANKILVAFYSDAKITLDGLTYLETNKIVKNEKDKYIFLSYSWSNSDIANAIDLCLSEKGFKIKRDVRDIGDWSSIRQFMESIREQDYSILIISQKYLESVNCMFEVMELIKDQKYQKKIFPIVVDKNIYSAKGKIAYIKYWENQCKELEDELKTIKIENCAELALELRKRNKISSTISEFLDLVADMNNPDIENVVDAIVNKLTNNNINP